MKMGKFINFRYILLITVLLALLMQETEARRKILKGRKTVTRTYVEDAALPAWAYVLLVALAEIIVGGIVFIIMKKRILDAPISGAYIVANTNP